MEFWINLFVSLIIGVPMTIISVIVGILGYNLSIKKTKHNKQKEEAEKKEEETEKLKKFFVDELNNFEIRIKLDLANGIQKDIDKTNSNVSALNKEVEILSKTQKDNTKIMNEKIVELSILQRDVEDLKLNSRGNNEK